MEKLENHCFSEYKLRNQKKNGEPIIVTYLWKVNQMALKNPYTQLI